MTLPENRSSKAVMLVLLSVALLLGAAGCLQKVKPSPKKEEGVERGAKFFPKTKPSAVTGRRIFDANCAACHGPGGAGDGPDAPGLNKKPADFTYLDFMRLREPQEFYESITNGKEPMPTFKKKLTAKERWDALFFIWSRATSPMQIAGGKNIYTKNCAACHGKSGDGKGVASSGLKKRPPRLNDPRLMMKETRKSFFTVVGNGEKEMPAFRDKLTEDQRWNVIDYIWTFVYVPAPE